MDPSVFDQIVKNNWIPVVFANMKGVVQYTNPAADNLYGYGSGELIGHSVSILNGNPELPTNDIILEVCSKGGWSGEGVQRKKDGSLIHVQLTVWLIKDEAGNPIGMGSNCKDISAEKKAEELLKEERAALRAIINNTQDAILSLDEQFNLVEFNQALADKVTRGYGFELKPGMSIFRILPPGSGPGLKKIYERVLRGEKILNVDEFTAVNGTKIYHETSYHPIEKDGRITGIAIFSRDTTERMKREKVLETTLKEKEILISEVHHRVKNNLAIVSGFLQMEEFNTSSKEVMELLKDSKARIKTTALVHELLYKNNSISHIDLSAYIKDLIRLISKTYRQNHIQIDVSADLVEKQISIQHAISIGLILNELVSNAYKHAFAQTKKGEIFIALRGDLEYGILMVTDNGSGLPSDFSFEESTSTGMMLVKTFTEQLGGKIEVKREKGTKFIITFGHEHGPVT